MGIAILGGRRRIFRNEPPPGGGGSFAFANQNALGALTVFNTQPWDVKPIRGVNDSEGWINDTDEPTGCSIGSDATAPVSPNNILIADFNVGLPRGDAPMNLLRPFADPGEQFNTLYIGTAVKLSANFAALQIAGCKFLWPATDQVQGTHNYSGFDTTDLTFKLFQQGTIDRIFDPNLGQDALTNWIDYRGVWRELEIIVKVQSSEFVADGEFHCWHGGVKTHQYTDIQFQMDGAPLNWKSLTYTPTYGGDLTGTQAPLETEMFMYMDHLIMATGTT